MRRLPSRNTWKGFALLLFMPLICLGCGDFDAPGSDKSGSIFMITEIDPVYNGESTRQVDLIQDNCSTDPTEVDPEYFSDHFADVTFTNESLSDVEQTATTIDLREYYVWYEPVTLGSPPLAPFIVRSIQDGNGIQPCLPGIGCEGETITQIEFVPFRVKLFLAPYLSDAVPQFQYNIHYRFFGVNVYGYEVSAESATNFYAADYDNCSN